MTEVC